LKMDAQMLSEVYKSSGSCGIRAGCLNLFRAADRKPSDEKNIRQKNAKYEERSVPTLGIPERVPHRSTIPFPSTTV